MSSQHEKCWYKLTTRFCICNLVLDKNDRLLKAGIISLLPFHMFLAALPNFGYKPIHILQYFHACLNFSLLRIGLKTSHTL